MPFEHCRSQRGVGLDPRSPSGTCTTKRFLPRGMAICFDVLLDNASCFATKILPTCLISPRLYFGEARVTVEPVGDADANTVSGESGEGNGALDQVVAANRSESDPSRAVPA